MSDPEPKPSETKRVQWGEGTRVPTGRSFVFVVSDQAPKAVSTEELDAELRKRFGGAPKPAGSEVPLPAPEEPWFTDAEQLKVDAKDVDWDVVKGIVERRLRKDIEGRDPGSFVHDFSLMKPDNQEAIRLGLHDLFRDNKALVSAIEDDPQKLDRVQAIVRAIKPKDLSAAENEAVDRAIKAWVDAKRPGMGGQPYWYDVLLVPGYTPLDATQATPGVTDVTRKRLILAVEQFRAQRAPFILVTGANVYPRGTPYYEAIEMKKALLGLGISADRILVEAAARHTTTNLRNSGRAMLRRGLKKANVVTVGGGAGPFDQHFYLACADLSTFNARCCKELGYEPGSLTLDEADIEFVPSPQVKTFGWKDPLDP